MRLTRLLFVLLWVLAPVLAEAQQRVTVQVIAAGITTNTTSAAKEVPNGPKTFTGQVVCSSGACVQTQAIYGTNGPGATVANAMLICTITLTATTSDFDACAVTEVAYARYFVVTTSTSGTNATGAVYVAY